MPDFDYDKYMQELDKPVDAYDVSKGQKWGMGLSALASVFTNNQRPLQGFMNSMQMIQEQKMAQHQAALSNFRAQMDAVSHQKNMQAMELRAKAMEDDMALAEKQREIYQKQSESQIGGYYDEQKHKMEMDQKKRENMIKMMDKISGMAQKYGAGIGGEAVSKAPQYVGKKTGEKKEAVGEKISGIAEKRETDVDYAGLSPQALAETKGRLGIRSPDEEQAAQVKAQKDYLDMRERVLRVNKLETDAEAQAVFYGVVDGTVDVRTLSRPVRGKIRKMLDEYIRELKDDELDRRKTEANIAQSYASAESNRKRTELTGVEIEKAIKELNNIDNQPGLTFDEIKNMPMNVRNDYYYDPILRMANVNNNQGIISQLRTMKDEGMPPEEMAKFLMSLATESENKSYADFYRELGLKSGKTYTKPKPDEVSSYIESLGYKITESGDYAFSTSFSKGLQDPDKLRALLNEVYLDGDKSSISNEQYTGNE